MLHWCRVCSKVAQLYIFFFRFFSQSHRRALSSVPCTVQWVLVENLCYVQPCVCAHPRLLVCPFPQPFPLGTLSLFSKSVSLPSFVNRIIYINFLKSWQHTHREGKQSPLGSVSEPRQLLRRVWAPPQTLLFLSPLCLWGKPFSAFL